MRVDALTEALEAGKGWRTILQERAAEADGLADKYRAEAELHSRRSVRYRSATVNADRWEAHAAGLREAETIVRIAQGWAVGLEPETTAAEAATSGDPGSTAYWSIEGPAIRPGATAAEVATSKGDPQ
jgi:hypothetical protein